MGFLSGRKKVDSERDILKIRATINVLTLKVRQFESRIEDKQKAAREAMARGDRNLARSQLAIAVDLGGRRSRYQQQLLTLETALLNIEEAKDQDEVLKAFATANTALAEARKMLSPTEIQTQLDRLSGSFDDIAVAGDLLSQPLTDSTGDLEAEEEVSRQLNAMEAEVLLQKEGVLPPLGEEQSVNGEGTERKESDEKRIEELLDELEREAREEREREAQ